MKIKKKERIIIKHNKKLLYAIIILSIILGILIYLIIKIDRLEKENNYCRTDKDCFPESCCHANFCINSNKKPNCSEVFCTQECSSPLDCNKSKCACINNKCEVNVNK